MSFPLVFYAVFPETAQICKKAKTAGLTCGFCNKKRGEK
jgi:hypothetical protein